MTQIGFSYSFHMKLWE